MPTPDIDFEKLKVNQYIYGWPEVESEEIKTNDDRYKDQREFRDEAAKYDPYSDAEFLGGDRISSIEPPNMDTDMLNDPDCPWNRKKRINIHAKLKSYLPGWQYDKRAIMDKKSSKFAVLLTSDLYQNFIKHVIKTEKNRNGDHYICLTCWSYVDFFQMQRH